MKDFSAIRNANWTLREKFTRLILVAFVLNAIAVFFISKHCSRYSSCSGHPNHKTSTRTDTYQIEQKLKEVQQRLEFLEQLLKRSHYFKTAWGDINLNDTTTNLNATEQTITTEDSSVTTDTKLSGFWSVDEDYKENADKLNELFTVNKTSGHVTRLLSSQRCTHDYVVLILITTHATNFERRESIRKSWGIDPLKRHPRWKVMFLVGRPAQMEYSKGLIQEMNKYNDIIIGAVIEDFYQLTYKILMGFEWALKYCKFNYLFKGDDDVFINMPRLFNFLRDENTPKKGLYAGSAQYQAHVKRSGRYAVSVAEFNKPYYPRYCSGGGFILSKDVVEIFIKTFTQVPILRIDDAYVGILALKAGVDILDSKDFRMYEKEDQCDYNEHTIAHHPVKTGECMKKLFNQNRQIVKRKAI